MPTFLHAADLHIDSPLRGLETKFRSGGGAVPAAFVEKVRHATREAFRKMVQVAVDQRVSFVVLAGDVVDGDATLRTASFLSEQFGRLKSEGIPVLVAHGNHDCAGLAPQHLAPFDGVQVFAKTKPETRVVAGVAVHGQSYPVWDERSDLSKEYPERREGLLNVGVLHTALAGSEGHESYAPTTPQLLAAKRYDYWALGHVHTRPDPWPVVDGCPLVFPGNLQGRNARETGAKGCVLVDYEGPKVTGLRFVPCDVVRWHHVTVQARSTATETQGAIFDEVLSATQEERRSDLTCAVRVTVTGKHADAARWRGAAVDWRENLAVRMESTPGIGLEKLLVEVEDAAADAAAQLQGARALLQQAVEELAKNPSAWTDLFQPLWRQVRGRSSSMDWLENDVGGVVPRQSPEVDRDMLRHGLDSIMARMKS